MCTFNTTDTFVVNLYYFCLNASDIFFLNKVKEWVQFVMYIDC